MPQNYTDDVFAPGHVGQTDLQNIENDFACLKSGFSGAASPSNPVAGMRWYDTTKKVPRLFNSGGTAWLAFLTGSNAQKLWIYRNDSDEGWAIDATVTDRVLAVKGGTQAYNVNGGSTAGTFTISGLSTNSVSHNHKWFVAVGPVGSDKTYNSSGSAVVLPVTSKNGSQAINWFAVNTTTGLGGASTALSNAYTNNYAHSHTVSHDGTTRPAAAVGTLQYPDI